MSFRRKPGRGRVRIGGPSFRRAPRVRISVGSPGYYRRPYYRRGYPVFIGGGGAIVAVIVIIIIIIIIAIAIGAGSSSSGTQVNSYRPQKSFAADSRNNIESPYEIYH